MPMVMQDMVNAILSITFGVKLQYTRSTPNYLGMYRYTLVGMLIIYRTGETPSLPHGNLDLLARFALHCLDLQPSRFSGSVQNTLNNVLDLINRGRPLASLASQCDLYLPSLLQKRSQLLKPVLQVMSIDRPIQLNMLCLRLGSLDSLDLFLFPLSVGQLVGDLAHGWFTGLSGGDLKKEKLGAIERFESVDEPGGHFEVSLFVDCLHEWGTDGFVFDRALDGLPDILTGEAARLMKEP